MWLFLAALLLAAYILFGWPLLLGLLARCFGRPVKKQFQLRNVTAIIAVYNGEKFLPRKLDSLFAQNYPQDLLDVIVVSDGSTDRTDAIAAADPRVKLIRVERGGKCLALNAGAAQAHGEILFLTDVRQELDGECIRNLIANFADRQVGVVSGGLKIRVGDSAGSQDVGLYWRFEKWIRNQLSLLDSMFGATGSVCAIRRELFVPIPADILLDDMYLPLMAFFKGYRLVIDESAIAWDLPTSVDTEFIRKVRTLAGNYQLLWHFPSLLMPFRNRMWLHFVSYKMGRLLLPWLLLVMFVSGFFLPAPWRIWAVGGQVLVYLLALLDPVIGKGPLKKLSSPARTFCVMMLAAAIAVRIFLVDPRSLWVVTAASKKAD